MSVQSTSFWLASAFTLLSVAVSSGGRRLFGKRHAPFRCANVTVVVVVVFVVGSPLAVRTKGKTSFN